MRAEQQHRSDGAKRMIDRKVLQIKLYIFSSRHARIAFANVAVRLSVPLPTPTCVLSRFAESCVLFIREQKNCIRNISIFVLSICFTRTHTHRHRMQEIPATCEATTDMSKLLNGCNVPPH